MVAKVLERFELARVINSVNDSREVKHYNHGIETFGSGSEDAIRDLGEGSFKGVQVMEPRLQRVKIRRRTGSEGNESRQHAPGSCRQMEEGRWSGSWKETMGQRKIFFFF